MESIAVLGIDAADHALAEQWKCENLLLDTHQPLKSFSYSIDVPATLEVWPSIATGLHPTEHGVMLQASDRDMHSRVYRIAVQANQTLPLPLRDRLREIKQRFGGVTSPQTSASTIFQASGGTVYNWPGVTPCDDWQRESEWFEAVVEGEMSEQEFYKRHLGHVGKGIGWLAAQIEAGVPVAGVHVHMLDHMGHLYGDRPDELRRAYIDVDSLIEWLCRKVDSLVILSDHGMQSTAIDADTEAGVHSERSFVAAKGVDETLPQSVFDVHDWLLDQVSEVKKKEETVTTADAPMEHLEDLGYL